eukprot:CAMPEP_0115874640 /NCGR_PEP_ID=MMETSP0287-20121206/24652_1 /TAXON_ID=412157 /ORGANISM="Chrysochromulina rotalis, Strain UIO044" /LENGTH=146 /DNA_ID=CAMNT_0003329811 /DNA_START=46 /DNA_END=486 /DNA_ORIENTATION=+
MEILAHNRFDKGAGAFVHAVSTLNCEEFHKLPSRVTVQGVMRHGDGRRWRVSKGAGLDASDGLGFAGGSHRGMPNAVAPSSMAERVYEPYVFGRFPACSLPYLAFGSRRDGSNGGRMTDCGPLSAGGSSTCGASRWRVRSMPSVPT